MKYSSPDSLEPSYDCGGDAYYREEALDVSVKVRCDTPIIFHSAKHTLDDVSLFTKGLLRAVRNQLAHRNPL